MRSRYRFRYAVLLLAALLVAGPLALDAAAQSRGRGGTASDTTRVRGRTSRTAPARNAPRTERATPRTERASPSRTERSTPRTERSTPRTERSSPSRTERTSPNASRAERSGRVVRGERAARGRTASPASPAEQRRETVRREPVRRVEPRSDDRRRDDRRYDDRRYDDRRRDDRRYRRDWYRPTPPRHAPPQFRVRPGIHIDIVWPWEHRHHRRWAPRYQYRQVVVFESGYGARRGRLDVRTRYVERVRYASSSRAEVDIFIESFELYDGGRFVGVVDRIPRELSHIRATLYRDGRVDFDREVFLVGDPYAGFEVISAPYYDGYILDAYDRAHRLRVGRVDLRRERVVPVRHSRLFDPYDFNGFVPISLLPEDPTWLMDYGYGAVSTRYYEDHDDRRRYDEPYDDGYYYGFDGGSAAPRGAQEAPVLRLDNDQTFETDRAGAIRLQREVELRRVE